MTRICISLTSSILRSNLNTLFSQRVRAKESGKSCTRSLTAQTCSCMSSMRETPMAPEQSSLSITSSTNALTNTWFSSWTNAIWFPHRLRRDGSSTFPRFIRLLHSRLLFRIHSVRAHLSSFWSSSISSTRIRKTSVLASLGILMQERVRLLTRSWRKHAVRQRQFLGRPRRGNTSLWLREYTWSIALESFTMRDSQRMTRSSRVSSELRSCRTLVNTFRPSSIGLKRSTFTTSMASLNGSTARTSSNSSVRRLESFSKVESLISTTCQNRSSSTGREVIFPIILRLQETKRKKKGRRRR